jgi:hypothetical protein
VDDTGHSRFSRSFARLPSFVMVDGRGSSSRSISTMKISLYGLIVGLLISMQGIAAPSGQFEFFADSLAGNQGSQVIVPIRASGFDSIISIQGTIAFDSSVLAFVGVQNMNLPSMSNANFGTILCCEWEIDLLLE